MMTEKRRSLKIAYLWQSATTEMPLSKVTATSLHMRSVIDALRKRGHQVRIISLVNGQAHWSDDGATWQMISPVDKPSPFRVAERLIRGIQSRLNLPYFNLFDSYRFSEACVQIAADTDVFYERFWILASGGLMASGRLGVPIVYEVNGDIAEEYRLRGNTLPRLHWSAIHFVSRQMFRYAGKVIAVNDVLMKRLGQRYRPQPGKICVIDNGARVEQRVLGRHGAKRAVGMPESIPQLERPGTVRGRQDGPIRVQIGQIRHPRAEARAARPWDRRGGLVAFQLSEVEAEGDLLLVTGPVTRNMEIPLRRTYEATPAPKFVVAVGDCARDCGVFKDSYAVVGPVDRIVPVDVYIAGCPPRPEALLDALMKLQDQIAKQPIGAWRGQVVAA